MPAQHPADLIARENAAGVGQKQLKEARLCFRQFDKIAAGGP